MEDRDFKGNILKGIGYRVRRGESRDFKQNILKGTMFGGRKIWIQRE